VKVLLQSVDTLSFVGSHLDWTANADEALDFVQVVRAVDYAFTHGLDDVRAVIKFHDPRFDFQLPPVPSLAPTPR
jgi:hypothetical protein